MEEILASIRKIISEDAPEAAAPPAPQTFPPAPQPVHDDVLELTQEVEAPAPVPPPPPAPKPAPAVVEEIVFQSVAPAPTATEHSDIFSDRTRKVMEDTFNSIPDEDEPAPAPAPVRAAAPRPSVESSTVESVFERAVRESFEPVLQQYLSDNSAVVIERMKPLIREWMDEHFPALLEGVVRAEVERVVKARGSKR
jgi:cell pole-organizing protein PopZ